jgi:hypothetical protein
MKILKNFTGKGITRKRNRLLLKKIWITPKMSVTGITVAAPLSKMQIMKERLLHSAAP